MIRRFTWLAALTVLALPGVAAAQSPEGNWSALTSDRTAAHVGDALTVVILETTSANTSAQSDSQRDTRLSGAASANGVTEAAGGLGMTSGFDGRGQTVRSGRLIGQIGVVVDAVFPNGDLLVRGRQVLEIDGERTAITLTGRVRRADIAADNSVVSSRIADAHITYDADGTMSRSASPGLLNRILSLLGLA